MHQDKKDFLSLAIPPARLGINEAAWMLGFGEHDISVLVSAGLLKPLGHPTASGFKYFATVELQKLRMDTRWLGKESDIIVNDWKSKTGGRRQKPAGTSAD